MEKRSINHGVSKYIANNVLVFWHNCVTKSINSSPTKDATSLFVDLVVLIEFPLQIINNANSYISVYVKKISKRFKF